MARAALFCAFGLLAPQKHAVAQIVQDVERAQSIRTETSPPFGSDIWDGHAVPSPNDADLGEQEIFQPTGQYRPFTASIAAPFYWTSNVLLARTGEQSDFIVAPMASLAYQPRIADGFYGMISAREQLFYYDRFNNLNFGALDVEAGLSYSAPQLYNLTLRGGYLYERLTAKNSFHDFFSNHALLLNAELPFHLGSVHQFSVGVDATISLAAEPDPPQRNDYELYLAYTVRFSRAFSIDTIGRVVLRDYHLSDRLDVSEVLGITANYSVTKFLTASAMSTLAVSRSNHSFFDYEVANLGGLVSLSISF